MDPIQEDDLQVDGGKYLMEEGQLETHPGDLSDQNESQNIWACQKSCERSCNLMMLPLQQQMLLLDQAIYSL
jgi:hypothetical protein